MRLTREPSKIRTARSTARKKLLNGKRPTEYEYAQLFSHERAILEEKGFDAWREWLEGWNRHEKQRRIDNDKVIDAASQRKRSRDMSEVEQFRNRVLDQIKSWKQQCAGEEMLESDRSHALVLLADLEGCKSMREAREILKELRAMFIGSKTRTEDVTSKAAQDRAKASILRLRQGNKAVGQGEQS